jgi:hypothetical protein
MPCPRCGGVLVEDREEASCANGCGAWNAHGKMSIPRAAFDKRVDGQIWWTLGTGDGARCPQCARHMMTYGTLYEYCSAHGAWVDAIQRNNFRAHFAGALSHAREVDEVVTAASEDPRTLADRVVTLEREVADLRARLERLERKLP